MYINIFGCAGPEYDSGIYTYKELGREGVKWADGCPVMCDRNSPNPYISTIYWVGYIVISALGKKLLNKLHKVLLLFCTACWVHEMVLTLSFLH